MTSTRSLIIQYGVAVLFVVVTGILAWWISRGLQNDQDEPQKQPDDDLAWKIQVIGWTGASLYRKPTLQRTAPVKAHR